MKPRQLPRGTWSKPIGFFYSIKNDARFWVESHLERDALLVLEFDGDVEAYRPQPLSFCYKTEHGKPARYTPDYLCKSLNNNQLIFREVKPADKVTDDLRRKVAWINRHVEKNYGARLEIITDNEIRVGSKIENLDLLYPYKRVNLSVVYEADILPILPREISFRELIEKTSKAGVREVIPYALLAHGILKFDIESKLNDETRLVIA